MKLLSDENQTSLSVANFVQMSKMRDYQPDTPDHSILLLCDFLTGSSLEPLNLVTDQGNANHRHQHKRCCLSLCVSMSLCVRVSFDLFVAVFSDCFFGLVS